MLKKTTRTLSIAALLALPLWAGAAAGEDERPGFDTADEDGDGRISLDEAKAAGVPEAEAKREDIDNDGELTKADWKFVDMEPPQSSDGAGSDDS